MAVVQIVYGSEWGGTKGLAENGKTGDFRSPHHIATWVDAIEKDLPD